MSKYHFKENNYVIIAYKLWLVTVAHCGLLLIDLVVSIFAGGEERQRKWEFTLSTQAIFVTHFKNSLKEMNFHPWYFLHTQRL